MVNRWFVFATLSVAFPLIWLWIFVTKRDIRLVAWIRKTFARRNSGFPNYPSPSQPNQGEKR